MGGGREGCGNFPADVLAEHRDPLGPCLSTNEKSATMGAYHKDSATKTTKDSRRTNENETADLEQEGRGASHNGLDIMSDE
jgi:hypothetical protein